jgi:hypothetical protein
VGSFASLHGGKNFFADALICPARRADLYSDPTPCPRGIEMPCAGLCTKRRALRHHGYRCELRNAVPRPTDGRDQSLQKSLKRVVLNSVYLTVCWIETCPSQSWIALVSWPSLASL